MPILISAIVSYMVYENTFSELEKDILTSHNIVGGILMLLIFLSIIFRV